MVMKDISSKLSLGADPELFFKKGKVIVGSERIIPQEGLKVTYGSVVRDGVQLEIHPQQGLGSATYPIYGIANAIETLQKQLKSHPGVSLCFDGMVDVTKAELENLSQESRVLGCQPSENIYGLKPVEVDPMRYRKRSAGGHVHLGLPEFLYAYRMKLPPTLDVLLGIPCVLLDRDNGQAERRKLYGRAGEYRLPAHGLEYRTLSNFWLHSPILAEFVFSQTRLAANVIFTTVSQNENLEKELLSKVNFRTMIRAIQTNSAALAWDVWKDAVRPFVAKHAGGGFTSSVLIERFEKLVDLVAKDGLSVVGSSDPVKNWAGTQSSYWGGVWSNFLTNNVK